MILGKVLPLDGDRLLHAGSGLGELTRRPGLLTLGAERQCLLPLYRRQIVVADAERVMVLRKMLLLDLDDSLHVRPRRQEFALSLLDHCEVGIANGPRLMVWGKDLLLDLDGPLHILPRRQEFALSLLDQCEIGQVDREVAVVLRGVKLANR